ncbi:response regulator [Rhodoblastus acidophilus]|uniref:Response regulator n=1 Tax=Candidatus Rhodoblastus alkanivorans TaxID=2954117 RepID=A0ABS9Z6K2_9HYPH|nr:response regulator [Candidatus Rhodoblastus alkanivorans]MCI4680211.1 response regulator [Candidatus Rhodoblastus alkanivorans]MCI4682267.1 response regulator [Candidatus Rhodoblastus alkanivorans]MDI4639569.1 response regulator [Rhodoblastus acidophilus]
MRRGLIVDDSAVIRMVAGRILGLLHFQSEEVDNRAKALAICERLMPDVILLDGGRPGAETLDFMRTIRRMPGGEATKIIFCATENDPMAIGRALRAGADDILFKPFDRRTMQEKFEDVGLLA